MTVRNEKLQTTWDLTPLFAGDDDPLIQRKRRQVKTLSYAFIDSWKDRTDYLKDPLVLRRALDEYESWRRRCGTDGAEWYYFYLRTQQDQNDPGLKARFNTIDEFSRKIGNDIQFFYLRIAKIPARMQKQFLAHRSLRKYRHFLSRIFAESRYLLSEPEEKVLNLKSSTSYANWTRMVSGFLAGEERSVLLEDGSRSRRSFSEILSLMNSRNRAVRDTAARSFHNILARHEKVAEAEINSVLAHKKTDDELRGIPRPDLARHISDDIDSDVVDSLIRSVSERFDIPHRYYALKARLLGVRKLKYHERNVDLGDLRAKYSFGKTVRLMRKVCRDLDAGFLDILERFAANGQFDVHPAKGKAGGAFCAHHLITQPTYILLNHTDKLHDVLTFAHELGHGINNELIREEQHALDFGTPTSTAEVASTFMEDFVLEEILRESNDEQRLAIMVMKLNDDVSTIFRQVACYRFEQELHDAFRKKMYLSADEIGKIFRQHMAAYMGKAVAQSPGSEKWWVYWSHIRYFFYVYSYASGLLISKSLQRSVKESPAFIGKVKRFLAAGLSDSPKAVFLNLGIDISDDLFWNRGLDQVENLLQETEELARKTGKI